MVPDIPQTVSVVPKAGADTAWWEEISVGVACFTTLKLLAKASFICISVWLNGCL